MASSLALISFFIIATTSFSQAIIPLPLPFSPPAPPVVGPPIRLPRPQVGPPTRVSPPVVGPPVRLPRPQVGPPTRVSPPVVGPPVRLPPPLVGPPVRVNPPVVDPPAKLPVADVTIVGVVKCSVVPAPPIRPIAPSDVTLSCDGGRTAAVPRVRTDENGVFTFTVNGEAARAIDSIRCAIFTDTRGLGCRALKEGEVFRARMVPVGRAFVSFFGPTRAFYSFSFGVTRISA